MEYAITFLEGVITFISPCLLPLLPVYVAYFAPSAGSSAFEGGDRARLRNTLVCSLGFVAGFTLLFTLMGGFAAAVGGFFREHQAVLNAVCGIVVVVLGLNFMGILPISALQRTVRMDAQAPRGFLSSLVFGMVFAVGWTPCVGAFLGSALSLAATTGSTAQGIALLVCYSLGLGIPFVLAALLIDRLEGAFSWVKSHYGIINKVCGGLLVVVGVLMATGRLGLWLSSLSSLSIL